MEKVDDGQKEEEQPVGADDVIEEVEISDDDLQEVVIEEKDPDELAKADALAEESENKEVQPQRSKG